jgi:hypothetical protein
MLFELLDNEPVDVTSVEEGVFWLRACTGKATKLYE